MNYEDTDHQAMAEQEAIAEQRETEFIQDTNQYESISLVLSMLNDNEFIRRGCSLEEYLKLKKSQLAKSLGITSLKKDESNIDYDMPF